MKKYYIVSLDGFDKFKVQTRKEAVEIAERESFNEDAFVFFVCETEKRTIRKMVDVILA